MTEAAATGRGVPVLILNYNGWGDTFHAIETMSPYLEDLWLIDNASTEDRLDEAARRFPKLRTLRNPVNGGWGYGYNRALEAVAAEGYAAAYLVNNDAFPDPGAVEAAAAVLAERPDAAACGSVILNEDRSVHFAGLNYREMNDREYRQQTVPTGVKAVRHLHGAGMAISIAAFKELGGFPEQYFMYWEDTDWFHHAKAKGWNVLLSGNSLVKHLGKGSDSGGNADYYLTRNRFLALRRGVYVSGRRETLVGLTLEHLPDCDKAAYRCGLVDGVCGVFGKRAPMSPARRLLVFLLAAFVFPRRAARKARSRMGALLNGRRVPSS